MAGSSMPVVCHRLGKEMRAQAGSRWPVLISAIFFSLLLSGLIAIDVEGAANNYVVANYNNNNRHQSSVTSPPLVSAAAEAAAAAALGGIDVGRSLVTALLGSPETSTPAPRVHQTVLKMSSASERTVKFRTTNAPQQVVATLTIGAQTTTTRPPVLVVKAAATVVSTSVPTIAHKHSGKVINVSDTLHKFDLYLDPVCDQINKLTSKQLSKVYVQLRQFSQKNNDALAKCFNGHGFPLDLSLGQQQARSNRDNLANFCSARSLANAPYKQFSACAAKSWSKMIEVEIDHALRDRLQGNKVTTNYKSGSQHLTSAEMSLIDEIVAQLHDGQVAEITTELAGEQQQQQQQQSTGSKTSGAKDAAATKVITVQQVDGGNSHQSSGKSEIKVSSGKQKQFESVPSSSAVVSSKSSENLSVNEHSAQKAITTTTSITSSTTSVQAPSQGTNLAKDFRANVAGSQFANNVHLNLLTTIAPSFTQLNGPTPATGNKAQLSIVSVDKQQQQQQQPTGAPSSTSVVLLEDTKKSAAQAGGSMKVVEEHKSQSVNLVNAGGNSIKLTAGGTSTQVLTTNQQNSQANKQELTLVNNLKPLPPPPTSLPPPPAVIPPPPTQIGPGPPLAPVAVPAQVPLPPAVPIVNQVPPPPPAAAISPLANMMLNSISLTTIAPLAQGAAASAGATSTSSLNPPPPPPPPPPSAPVAGNFNGLGASAAAASSASGGQNGAFNDLPPAASTAAVASPVGPAPAAPVAPTYIAPPPQNPSTAVAAASGAAGPVAPLPMAPAGASSSVGVQSGPFLPAVAPAAAPAQSPPTTPPTNGVVIATVPDQNSFDLLHPDHQLDTPPVGIAAAAPAAGALSVAGTTLASAKNAAGEIAIAQAPAKPAGVRMEHAMLKNVDIALDVLNAAGSATTTTPKPSKLVELTSATVVKDTLDNVMIKTDKLASVMIPVTTTTRAPVSVIVIEANDQENETKKKSQITTSAKSSSSSSVVTKEKSHNDEGGELTTSSHDVIVVGEHVEGDDLVHDHEDHSHHDDDDNHNRSVHKSKSSHHEHDESDSGAKIEHTNQSSEIKKTTTTTSSSSTKTSSSEAHEEDHSDHEHIIEGLKDGDVIHVEAAELEGHEGGN